jgi:hypothetical protein
VTIAVAVLALAVAVAIAVLQWPRPPDLDGERWFKAWLTTLLRGRADAAGLSAEAWAAEVVGFAPYHPAGRTPERKVCDPTAELPTPALPGEASLVEALAKLPERSARWARMYDLDELALADRLSDPIELGPAYQPSRWLGAGCTWDVIAAAGGDHATDLVLHLSRGSRARWVLVGAPPPGVPDVLAALSEVLGERAIRFEADSAPSPEQPEVIRAGVVERRHDAAFAAEVVALLGLLESLFPTFEERVVLVGVGPGIQVVLEALRSHAPVRDQVEAVVSIGGVIHGLDGVDGPLAWEACTEWLQQNFRHKHLDLEANHRCPYLAVQWLDREADVPGAGGVPLDRARFPVPQDDAGPVQAIDVVDLGPLPADPDLPTRLVALALWGVTTAWVAARRG